MLRVDERASPTPALSLGNYVQRERGLAGALRSVDLDDAAAGHSADAECDIEAERTCRDHLCLRRGLMRPEFHNRTFAKGAFDLAERRVQSPLLVHHFLVQKTQRCLHYPSSLIPQPGTLCNGTRDSNVHDLFYDA